MFIELTFPLLLGTIIKQYPFSLFLLLFLHKKTKARLSTSLIFATINDLILYPKKSSVLNVKLWTHPVSLARLALALGLTAVRLAFLFRRGSNR